MQYDNSMEDFSRMIGAQATKDSLKSSTAKYGNIIMGEGPPTTDDWKWELMHE